VNADGAVSMERRINTLPAFELLSFKIFSDEFLLGVGGMSMAQTSRIVSAPS
jgi:hypothetical protein